METEPNIGRVFTPDKWAMWLLEETGAFQAWLDGATICDPNFGGGAFIVGLLKLASCKGIRLTSEQISRVFGCELSPSDKPRLMELVSRQFNVSLLEDNFTIGDVLSSAFDRKFDLLVGNPPWANFSVLPPEFRELWGRMYIKYGLVNSKREVLLGGSRADIATLILKKLLDQNLVDDGSAAFFLPLSIFFNSGSNDRFRPYPGSPHGYAVKTIWDFGDERIFSGVSTRYGAVMLRKSADQTWPVLTHVRESGKWMSTASTCSDGRQGFWQRHDSGNLQLIQGPSIKASEGQQPRQGINTCGANDVLLFTKEGNQFRNAIGDLIELEEELIYPLIDKSIFRASKSIQRYALIVHNKLDGRPLSAKQLSSFPKTMEFLNRRRAELESRKGLMLKGHIQRGLWWSLLGVGRYSFSEWKVVWEALGKSAFKPVVVHGRWQGNQALHAYCPCNTRIDADRLVSALSDPSVESYLLASAMGGTMNWAQPGRVGKLFNIEPSQQSLFS